MSADLIMVLALLGAAMIMFGAGRPRMDVVALIIIIALPVLGILDVPQTLAGFSDANVILIGALFVVGEGLARTGVTYRLGDWISTRVGASSTRLIVLLMLAVALLGAIMSSTGVVAIFIPVVLSLAARTGTSPRQLMMPLSFAGLISGMLTLIATPPNLIVDAELRRTGQDGLGFFTVTPFGLVILVLGITYMLAMRRFLAERTPRAGRRSGRRTFATLAADFGVEQRMARVRIDAGSMLIGTAVKEVWLGEDGATVLAVTIRRPLRPEVLSTDRSIALARGDRLILNALPGPERLEELGLTEEDRADAFFDQYSRQMGMAEVMITPESSALGKSVRDLALRSDHGVTALGVRHKSQAIRDGFVHHRFAAGDTVLVAGPWEAITALQDDRRDFVALDMPAEMDEVAPAADRAPLAILTVVVMIALMVTGIVPNVVAALLAALMMGAFKAIDMVSAYRSIHWPTLLLIAGMLPFAQALQVTGGVQLASDTILGLVGDTNPRLVLAALFIVTAVIGMFVSNTATAVLMAPIALTTAQQMDLSPLPFAIIVALAASSAFMTPVSSPVNTLVLEPGGYRFGDFVRMGVPFVGVVLVVSVLLVPVLLPF